MYILFKNNAHVYWITELNKCILPCQNIQNKRNDNLLRQITKIFNESTTLAGEICYRQKTKKLWKDTNRKQISNQSISEMEIISQTFFSLIWNRNK